MLMHLSRGGLQVPRLQSVVRDRRANWAQSIATLEAAKSFGARVTKTSIMLGCGESVEEVKETLQLLRASGASLCCNTVLEPLPDFRGVGQSVGHNSPRR